MQKTAYVGSSSLHGELSNTHPNLGDAVDHRIIRSEIDGGVYLRDLPVGGKLELHTENPLYTLVNRGGGRALLCGHPEFCPEPVAVMINGSKFSRDGSMLKVAFLGRGMHMEFRHPGFENPVVTTRIVELRQVQ